MRLYDQHEKPESFWHALISGIGCFALIAAIIYYLLGYSVVLAANNVEIIATYPLEPRIIYFNGCHTNGPGLIATCSDDTTVRDRLDSPDGTSETVSIVGPSVAINDICIVFHDTNAIVVECGNTIFRNGFEGEDE